MSTDTERHSNRNQGVDPEGLMQLSGFHQVMVSSGSKTAHIAGQVALDQEMSLVGEGDYRAQTIQALNNVALAARAAGAAPEDIVSSVFYICGLDQDGVNEAVFAGLAEALDGKPFPAHAFTMVGVETLAGPQLLIEISAMAVFD